MNWWVQVDSCPNCADGTIFYKGLLLHCDKCKSIFKLVDVTEKTGRSNV